MPPQLTQDQREQITAALFRREDAKEIADANGISERQVRRISQNLKQYGTVTAPRLKKMGRPTCLNKEIEDVCVPCLSASKNKKKKKKMKRKSCSLDSPTVLPLPQE